MNFYDIELTTIKGEKQTLNQYEGQVLLIVNTASKCGFTPQFKALEEINQKYSSQGLTVLGFPCDQFMNQELSGANEIESFCQLNYGVTFPLFEKTDVNGKNAHPVFKYLCSQQKGLFSKQIKWNFTKFLVDTNGNVVARFAPKTDPLEMIGDIEKLLQK